MVNSTDGLRVDSMRDEKHSRRYKNVLSVKQKLPVTPQLFNPCAIRVTSFPSAIPSGGVDRFPAPSLHDLLADWITTDS